MPVLRHIVITVLLLAQAVAAAHAAEAPGSIDATRSLAQAGAVQLALRRIDTLQPPDTAAPLWAVWEGLRLQLLARLERNDEVLQRAGVLPSQVSAPARAGLHATAAHAALALGQTAVARQHAGRALWTPGISAGTLHELRLLVIRSHVRDARADDAYRSMLRFEQDYRPLDGATAAVFVDALLDLGMAREAVVWLNLLDERGPAKLRLRLHTGVITPQDAVTQARAALGRSENTAWWRILLEAAERQNNGALRIAALEQLLEAKALPVAATPDAEAVRLWEIYAGHARTAANTHQLLAGDDAGWLQFAIRRRDTEAAEARAYLAYLARHARDPALQLDAQARLAAEYAAAKLPRTGLRVFGVWSGGVTALAAPTRHTLGALAETAGDHLRALQHWQGLPAADNMPAAVWSLRLSALALRAGRTEVAVNVARPLAAERSAIPAVQLPEWLSLAQQFTDHGLYDAAQALFERVLVHADPAQARRVLSGIARTHEARGQPLSAADFYLRSALGAPKEVPLGGAPKEVPLGGAPKEVPLGGAPKEVPLGGVSATDTAAVEARLLAGFSLARAGLRDDARAQFEWVLKNAGDPVQIAVARRELGF